MVLPPLRRGATLSPALPPLHRSRRPLPRSSSSSSGSLPSPSPPLFLPSVVAPPSPPLFLLSVEAAALALAPALPPLRRGSRPHPNSTSTSPRPPPSPSLFLPTTAAAAISRFTSTWPWPQPSPSLFLPVEAAVESILARARVEVGAAKGVVEELVALVEEHGNHVRELFVVCLARENCVSVVAAGAAAAVISSLGELARSEAKPVLSTIKLLCRTKGGREVVVAEGPLAMRALVRAMAGKASKHAVKHAARSWPSPPLFIPSAAVAALVALLHRHQPPSP